MDFIEPSDTIREWRRSYPGGPVLTFDEMGLLQTTTDMFDNTTEYTWNEGNLRLTAIKDPVGKITTFTYDGSVVHEIEDPSGRITEITRDGWRIAKITDPEEVVVLDMSYDADDRMTTRIDRRGGAWGFAYDHASKLEADTMPQIAVHGSGNERPVASFVSPWSAVLPDPASSQGSSTSNPLAMQGPEDAVGELRNALDHASKLRVDRFGAMVWSEDPLGRQAWATRDEHGRTTELVTEQGDTTQLSWCTSTAGCRAQLESVVQVNRDRSVLYEYSGSKVSRVHGDVPEQHLFWGLFNTRLDSLWVGSDQSMSRFTYDGRGRVRFATDPEGHTTEYQYQSTGAENMSSLIAPGSRTTSFTYDAVGRTIKTTNPLSHESHREYDVLNRVSEAVGALGDTTRFSHDALFQTKVTDAEGQEYEFEHNALGWVMKELTPAGDTLAYGYDAAGNVVSSTNRRGQTLTYTHDALGRVLTVSHDTNDLASWTYDPGGQWVVAETPESRDSIALLGDPVADTATLEHVTRGTETHTLRYRRALKTGRPTHLALEGTGGSGRSVSYTYNLSHQLVGLTHFDGATSHQTQITYDDDRLPTTYRLPWGDSIQVGLPSTHRAGQFAYTDPGAEQKLGLKLSQDALGRIAERMTAAEDTVRAYGYDAGGRLASYAVSEQTFTGGDCEYEWDEDTGFFCTGGTSVERDTIAFRDFTYDLVGNRTDSGALTGTGNRLLRMNVGTEVDSLVYDADGNLTHRFRDGVLWQALSWNALGQLEQVSIAGGDTLVSFGYDAFGRRVRKTTTVGAAETEIQYLWAGDHVFVELDDAGDVLASYSYYPGTDRPHAMERDGEIYHYGADVPGSVVGLVSSDSVRTSYRYGPFGTTEAATDLLFDNPLRFAGSYRDQETGLHYMRNRFYDAELGRFISEDPIGLAGGINLYAFVGNDPANKRDPFGLCSFDEDGKQKTICQLDEIVATAKRRNPSTLYYFARGANIPRSAGDPNGGGTSGGGSSGSAAGEGNPSPAPQNPNDNAYVRCIAAAPGAGMSMLTGVFPAPLRKAAVGARDGFRLARTGNRLPHELIGDVVTGATLGGVNASLNALSGFAASFGDGHAAAMSGTISLIGDFGAGVWSMSANGLSFLASCAGAR